ncbi:TPA: UV damage endonuclease UvsE, partial [Candidatus Avacholeplasma faecigallinarum]|nr:UV damage endonuclease UvsE [Candidatus Avacholeplasma faecigallinarum]
MRVRLGYVSISMAISATTSSPYTYSEYLKSGDLKKLDDVITSNLLNLEKIVNYNIKNNIHFYRISSKIIPLATKDD